MYGNDSKGAFDKIDLLDVWKRNWGDTKQKAPFITKRGRFELIRKDSHKRRLWFTVVDQQALFWIETRRICLAENRLSSISIVSTNEKAPF